MVNTVGSWATALKDKPIETNAADRRLTGNVLFIYYLNLKM